MQESRLHLLKQHMVPALLFNDSFVSYCLPAMDEFAVCNYEELPSFGEDLDRLVG
jgi:hypothetical protein